MLTLYSDGISYSSLLHPEFWSHLQTTDLSITEGAWHMLGAQEMSAEPVLSLEHESPILSNDLKVLI